MSSARTGRHPSLNFIALITAVIGALLLLVSERPELRARPGDEQVTAAPVVASVGHGLTWSGTAYLLYRMAAYGRAQARSQAPSAALMAREDERTGAPPVV